MEHIDPSCGMEPYSQVGGVTDTFGPIQVPLGSTVPSLSEEIPRNYDLPPFASGVTLAYQADATETAASELLLPSPVPRTGPRFESYTDDIWEVHKPRIRELYIEKNKKLREVMQHMTEEKGFKPSMSMYKTRLVAWGFFKNNREKDVTALLRLKQTRDVAGKSSVIFRAGKPVNEHQILNYLRRKRMNPQDLVSGEENDDQIPISDHICVRTPSPTLSAHLSLPSGNIRDGEAMLLSVKYWYTVWIGETCRLRDGSIPDHFQLAEVGGSNIVDCVSLLLRLGCRLLRHKRFVEGGAYVQGGFVIVENLLREMGDVSRGSKQSPVWIFGLWKLLMEKVPSEISKMFLAHITALGQQFLPGLHPAQEIMHCLCRVRNTTTHDVFVEFMSSTWTDIIHEITNLVHSNGLNAAACLPHTFWMGQKNNAHLRQFHETTLGFSRAEPITDWQQRNRDLAFTLCGSKQLYHAAPFHTHILTLMWLRRSVVDSPTAQRDTLLSGENQTDGQTNEICTVKSAILTRVELSLGKENNQSENIHIRFLSGDVYQAGHLHYPGQGEDIATFRRRHSLDTQKFEQAKAMFRANSGVETEKGAWLKWLQILEDSLISPQDASRVCEEERVESVLAHNNLRGKGFVCDYMYTLYGDIGISEEKERRNLRNDSPGEEGWMYCRTACFQT